MYLHEETKDLVDTMISKDLVKHNLYQKLIINFGARVCHIHLRNLNLFVSVCLLSLVGVFVCQFACLIFWFVCLFVYVCIMKARLGRATRRRPAAFAATPSYMFASQQAAQEEEEEAAQVPR